MDFADFNLERAAEEGAWVHLATNDQPLYRQADDTIDLAVTDRPCRVHVRGVGAPDIMVIVKRIQRRESAHQLRANKTKDSDLDNLVAKHERALEAEMSELIRVAVDKWENIVFDGQEVTPTDETKAKICGPNTPFFAPVYGAILEKRDFLNGAAKD